MTLDSMWWSAVDLLGVLAAITLTVVTAWACWYLVSDLRRQLHPRSGTTAGVRQVPTPDRGRPGDT